MLIFFIPLFIIITKSKENLCISLIEKSENEEKLTKLLSENLEMLINEELKSTPINSCINTLLSSGYFLSLDYYLNELSSKGIAYRETLSFSISNMENKLNSIYNKYRFTDNDYQKVIPAFQWAQNLQNIFIEVKFAHRHDSPGCLEFSKMNINIENKNISLEALCVLGDVPIKFELDLNLFDLIIKENSTYEKEAIGRYLITLKKNNNTYWKNLIEGSGEKFYPNMRIWLEMKEKYYDEIKEFETKNDDEEFKEMYERMEREEKEKEELRKKRRERKKNGTKKNKNKKKNKSIKDSNEKNNDL
jgi:hypothetical protein